MKNGGGAFGFDFMEKRNFDRKGGNIRMKKIVNKKLGIVLVSFALIFFFAWTSDALEVDGLSITGLVKSIDKGNGTIGVDVTTLSCKGLRVFRVPEGAREDLDSSLVGKKVQFRIDSATCKSAKIYDIVD